MSQYVTYQNKLIRVASDKIPSSNEINIKIDIINIEKTNDLTNLEFLKTVNKKGYFELVGFEKATTLIIKSNSIEFNKKKDKFISISSISLIYDTIQLQYNIYLLIQVESNSNNKLFEFLLGYYIIDNNLSIEDNRFKIVNRFTLPSSSSTLPPQQPTTTIPPQQDKIKKPVLIASPYTHKILDGPNLVSYNEKEFKFYIQSLDYESINSSNNDSEYQWKSIQISSISDSKPLLYYTIQQEQQLGNNYIFNEYIYQQIYTPVVIRYCSKPTLVFEQILLNSDTMNLQNKRFDRDLILNNLSIDKKENIQNNEIIHLINSTNHINYYGVLINQTIIIYKEDNSNNNINQYQQGEEQNNINKNNNNCNNVIWELKLNKKPSNIHFINIPLYFDPSNNNNNNNSNRYKQDEFEWSQGCIVISYQKSDELVQIYSISTKKLLNEIIQVEEIWICDFLSYGFQQLLVRHKTDKKDKKLRLSLIPLQCILEFKRNKINNDIGESSTIEKGNLEKNQKKAVSFKIIMESLENMSNLADSEYKVLEQQLKSKESLLNHSLKILESIGIPNSIYQPSILNKQQQSNQINIDQLKDWNYKLYSIFNDDLINNHNNSHHQENKLNIDNMDIDKISNNKNLVEPKLLSKSILIKDGILYCRLEFEKSIKSYNIVSVFLSSKDLSLFTKLRYTISSNNSTFGIGIMNNGSFKSTSILLETSLKELNIDYYSPNLINIICEWSIIQNNNLIEYNDLNYGNNLNSNSNIYSSYLESFNLNDYLLLNNNNNNNNNNNIINNNNNNKSFNYPYTLDFNIQNNNNNNNDLIEFIKNLDQIFPKNQFTIQGLSFFNQYFKDDYSYNENETITIQSNSNNNQESFFPFLEISIKLKSKRLISFKINSICFFNLINQLKLVIDKLPNGISINLSDENNEWNNKLKLEICNQLKQTFEIIIESEDQLSNTLTLSKKDQRNAFLKFHSLYQKVFQSLIETQSLIYNLEVLNKFNN